MSEPPPFGARMKPPFAIGDRVVVEEVRGAPSNLVGHRATVTQVDEDGIFVRFDCGMLDFLYTPDVRHLDPVERLSELA